MSSLSHLKNDQGVVVYSEILRQKVQLARQKHFEDLTAEEWCEGIDMPLECYATKVLMGVAPLTFKDIKGICTFCGTPAKELLDSVAGLGKGVKEQGITVVWDMEEVRKACDGQE